MAPIAGSGWGVWEVLTTIFVVRVDSGGVPCEELANCCNIAVAGGDPDVW